jgi:glutaminyl-peptide cyclotransferase
MLRENLPSREEYEMREGLISCLVAGVVIVLSLGAGCGKKEVPEFDQQRAFRFLEEQCNMGPRYPGSKGHQEVRKYIIEKLKSSGANVSLQRFSAVDGRGDTLDLVNIIANYNLTAPKRILLGAHYDTRPWADKDSNPANHDKPILGANDGASGVAVLLEVGRHVGKLSGSLGVDIVFFDGEDSGRYSDGASWILGSRYFVEKLKGYKPAAVIIVDMVGEKEVEIRREGFSRAVGHWLLDEIYSLAEELGFSEFKNEEGTTILDDHFPFIKAGLPAVDLIDFDYPFWHTLEDTPDKCSPRSLDAVGTVLLHYIWRQ